jgi:hypothetical protein
LFLQSSFKEGFIMGMDVYGRKPKSEVGEYFRRNVWGWHPLWSYCENVHEDLVSSVEGGHYNSGDGLSAQKSVKLAKALKEDLRSGNALKYIELRDKMLAELPDEDCTYCDQDGNRTWSEGENQVVKVCNACSGKKKIRPFETHYFLSVEDIRDFADFLEDCGGFNIH